MLATVLRTPAATAIQRRSFVSTVLLTRNWENESVNLLKKEAKKRGLLQTGNKSTLISRLKEFEREQLIQSGPPPAVQQQVRLASTTEVPGIPSTSQPSPIPPNYPKNFLDVKIPDISQPPPERPIDIPFVPDFWESSKVKAESTPPPPEPVPVKVLAVAGAATHIGGGPIHNLYPSTSASAAEPGYKSESSQTSSDSASGGWTLLGLFAGSWLVGGILAPTSAFAVEAESKESPSKSH